jgi:hypothetical protein
MWLYDLFPELEKASALISLNLKYDLKTIPQRYLQIEKYHRPIFSILLGSRIALIYQFFNP